MGFKQTAKHRFGKGSYHQIGLVRGQFGNVPEDQWLKFVAGHRLRRLGRGQLGTRPAPAATTDAGAAAYAKERVDLAKKHGLEIFTVAAHLQGQALGDEPSAKTLQFVGGEAVEAYKAWRAKGNKPPRTDPYYVPDDVGKLIHEQATRDLLAVVRFAGHLGKLQDRKVAVPGFVGSPAHCWSHWFLFPPLPAEHRRPQDPRRARGQPGTAGRALRPGARPVQAVRRHFRSGMSSERAGDGRPGVGQRLPEGDGQGGLRAASSASTSTARTWNGRTCR